MSLSLLYLLFWESQHPEDKFPRRGTTRNPRGCLGSRDRPGTVRCGKEKTVRPEGVMEKALCMDHRAPTPLGCRQHEEDVSGGQDMQGYVVTSHRVRDRSQHPGFWPVRKAPSGPSRGGLAPPGLTSEQGTSPSQTRRQQPRTLSSHSPKPCQRLSSYPTSATTKDGGGGTGHFLLAYDPGAPSLVSAGLQLRVLTRAHEGLSPVLPSAALEART